MRYILFILFNYKIKTRSFYPANNFDQLFLLIGSSDSKF